MRKVISVMGLLALTKARYRGVALPASVVLTALFIFGHVVEAQTLRGFTVGSALQSEDYDELQRWNTNVVRYHLLWDSRADTASGVEYLAWLDTALPDLDNAIKLSRARGIKVIVNLHTPPGGFKRSSYPSLHRLFADQWAMETFFEVWRRVSLRYAGDDTIWGFDILNEPALTSNSLALRSWESIATSTARIISSIDPTRRIIVEPPYGDQARLASVRKLSFPNLVMSIHLYYPLKFHQQGIYGNPLGVSYPSRNFTRASILKNLRVILRYQRATRGKIPIYVGEFTGVRWAPKNSSFRYLRDVVAIMERMKWHWTYHAFREYHAWDLELESTFGVIRKVIGQTNREALIRGFLSRNQVFQSPSVTQ